MKFHPSRLREELLLAKEVCLSVSLSLSLSLILLKHVSLGPANFLVADSNPALGHPIEFICLDLDKPAICKYCGLRYVQDHGHHHH